MKKSYHLNIATYSLWLLSVFALNAYAVVIDFTTAALTQNSDNIQATTSEGVVVTAYGYHVEFESASAVVYGPFPTSDNPSGLQYFGTDTASNFFSNPGLGLLVDTSGPINPVGDDTYGGGAQPGFDNTSASGAPLPHSLNCSPLVKLWTYLR